MSTVEVYWNVRSKVWSIRDRKTRKVVDRLAKLRLRNARFVVSEAGRQRVLRTGVKGVHAVVRGEWDESSYAPPLNTNYERVRYNPRRDTHFVTDDGAPVDTANDVSFFGDRTVYARGISEVF